MKETLRELYDREIASYGAEPLPPEESEAVEKMTRECYDDLYNALSIDDRLKLIKLQNYCKLLIAQKQRDAFINGFALAIEYMVKNDK